LQSYRKQGANDLYNELPDVKSATDWEDHRRLWVRQIN